VSRADTGRAIKESLSHAQADSAVVNVFSLNSPPPPRRRRRRRRWRDAVGLFSPVQKVDFFFQARPLHNAPAASEKDTADEGNPSRAAADSLTTRVIRVLSFRPRGRRRSWESKVARGRSSL